MPTQDSETWQVGLSIRQTAEGRVNAQHPQKETKQQQDSNQQGKGGDLAV